MLLGVVVATAPTGWLPGLANMLAREYLRVRDFSAVQIHIERLTPWNLRAALQLGTNAPVSQIDHIDIRFSPSGLWHARVDEVEIKGGVLQFCAGTNGIALCGLPSDLTRLKAGASPLDDEDAVRRTWRVGQVLLDNITLRLLPPGASGLSRNEDEPYEVCIHASAVADEDQTRFAIADYGRAGILANGAFRFDTGDGWLVAVLPESQVQEWVRVAQWFVADPRFKGRDLCVGNGGATFLARMEQWRPELVQGDFYLRAATLLDDFNLTYDVRAHGVAQWEEPETLRPTISVNADLGVRMALYKTVAWSDDRELPARASLAVKLTPRRTEWECQVAARATLSREATQACLPTGAMLVVSEASRLRLDGVFASPDLVSWDGSADAMAFVPQPRWAAGNMTFSGSDLVVHVTASFTNAQPAGARGWTDPCGLQAVGNGVACAGDVTAAGVSQAPFDQAGLTVTVRVSSLTLPAGAVVFDKDDPVLAIVSASPQMGKGVAGQRDLASTPVADRGRVRASNGPQVRWQGKGSDRVQAEADRWLNAFSTRDSTRQNAPLRPGN